MARPLLKPRGPGPGPAKRYLKPPEWSPAFAATFWGEAAAVSSYQLPVELSVPALLMAVVSATRRAFWLWQGHHGRSDE